MRHQCPSSMLIFATEFGKNRPFFEVSQWVGKWFLAFSRPLFSIRKKSHLKLHLYFSGVATGRGAQVGNEAGFCDRRSSEIQILRPLREFSTKEVSFFIQHNWDYSSLE